VQERFYALSVERKLKHPAVVAISESARQSLTAPPPASRHTHPGKTDG
jgi:LysR family transcriptional regulator, transcriptional activator of nhaA